MALFKRCQVSFLLGCQNDDIYRVRMPNTLETPKAELPVLIFFNPKCAAFYCSIFTWYSLKRCKQMFLIFCVTLVISVCSVSAPIQGKSQKLAVQAFFTFMGTLGQTTLCTKAIIKSKCCVQLLLLSTYSQADCFYLVPLDKRTKHPFSQSTQLQIGTLESLSPHFIHRLLLALYHNGAASVKQWIINLELRCLQ